MSMSDFSEFTLKVYKKVMDVIHGLRGDIPGDTEVERFINASTSVEFVLGEILIKSFIFKNTPKETFLKILSDQWDQYEKSNSKNSENMN
jgi:hypothetical protein